MEVSAVQFLQFDAFKGGDCDLSCRADLETFLAHGSCCRKKFSIYPLAHTRCL
jgi:hypothetical protein